MKKYVLLFFFIYALASCGDDVGKAGPQGKNPPALIGEALGNGYSCDSLHYYYHADTMDVAQPSTLKVLGGGYAKDGFTAYYQGKEVQGAQGSSFRWVGGDTATDVTDIYIDGIQQPFKSRK